MHPVTLRVPPGLTARRLQDAERPGLRYHAERGNDRRIDGACTASFPAKAGPTKSRPRTSCGTGFSREAFDLCFKGAFDLLLIFMRRKLRHRQSRLGCRPNADDAQWVEPHGCGESAVRAWMPVRRGPTERRRSEGTLTKEGTNQEQAPLVTWGAFPSNSPKAKCLPLGRPISAAPQCRCGEREITSACRLKRDRDASLN